MILTQYTLNGVVVSKTPEDICSEIFYESKNIYLHPHQTNILAITPYKTARHIRFIYIHNSQTYKFDYKILDDPALVTVQLFCTNI